MLFFRCQHMDIKKGMPLWLINEFRNLKNKTSSLGIFFHELFVTANFWDPRF